MEPNGVFRNFYVETEYPTVEQCCAWQGLPFDRVESSPIRRAIVFLLVVRNEMINCDPKIAKHLDIKLDTLYLARKIISHEEGKYLEIALSAEHSIQPIVETAPEPEDRIVGLTVKYFF